MRVEAIKEAMRQYYRDQYMFYQGNYSCAWAVIGYAAMWLSSAMHELNLFNQFRQERELNRYDEAELLSILTRYHLLTYPAFSNLVKMIKPINKVMLNEEPHVKPIRGLYKLLFKYQELYTLDNLRQISEFEFVFNEKVIRCLEFLGQKKLEQKVLTHIFHLCEKLATNQQAARVAVMDYCDELALDYTMENPALFFTKPRQNVVAEYLPSNCLVM